MYSADFNMDHAVPWTSAVKVSVLSAVSRFRSVREGGYGRLEVRHGKRVSCDMGNAAQTRRTECSSVGRRTQRYFPRSPSSRNRRPQNQGMCCGESRVEVFPQRAGNFSGVAGNLFRNLFVVVSEGGENLAVMCKAKIRQYGIAVIQRFCYNFRHESNHADPR